MLKIPGLPENLEGADLPALKAEFKAFFTLVKDGKFVADSDESVAAVEKATTDYAALKAFETEQKAIADKRAAALAAAAAFADEDDDPEEEPADDPEDPGEAAPEDDPEGEGADAAGEGDADTETSTEVVAATKAPAVRRPRPGVGAKDTAPLRTHNPGQFIAMDNVPGKRAGEKFVSYMELTEALIERQKTAGGEKIPVAEAPGNYPKERVLGEGIQTFNLIGLDGGWGKGTDEEMTAALCAPCTPYYDISCANTDRRPVFNSLPQFSAPRGCVSIVTSPQLSDITGGYGLWDRTNDAALPLQAKNACMTITCPSSTSYYFYAVYRCLTVQNFTAMTWPELVASYLNLLAAASARQAEKQLLDLMNVGTNAITASQMGLGASTTITVQLQHYLDGYAERARWDTPVMDMWAPRWLAGYIKGDITMRRNVTGGPPRVGTDADVARIFSDLGIRPHWYMDTPTWGTAAPTIQAGVGGAIPNGPGGSVKLLLAPAGKYALIDRGALNIGVDGNRMRDNTSLSYNQFTLFFETFEGIVNTNSCPADLVTLPVCFNGVQVDDADSTDCNGLSVGPS